MPKLLDNMETSSIPGLKNYQYSGIKLDRLQNLANDYTLVTIAVDVSGSVLGFSTELLNCLKNAVEACRKSPRASNLLLRVITFNHMVTEVHGFKPLGEINVDQDYGTLDPKGGTALYDTAASAVGAISEYSKLLAAQDYGVNSILFIITDGDDQSSTFSARTVKDRVQDALSGEVLESFVSILIGINAANFQARLQQFQLDAGITEYKDAGDVTPGNLAKLAAFVSRSISSQANALGTGSAAPMQQSTSIVI